MFFVNIFVYMIYFPSSQKFKFIEYKFVAVAVVTEFRWRGPETPDATERPKAEVDVQVQVEAQEEEERPNGWRVSHRTLVAMHPLFTLKSLVLGRRGKVSSVILA